MLGASEIVDPATGAGDGTVRGMTAVRPVASGQCAARVVGRGLIWAIGWIICSLVELGLEPD